MASRVNAMLAAFVGFAVLTLAQQSLYGQCGGNGWTGPTTCVSGACCTYSNDWYSQCLPGDCSSGGGSGTTTATTTTGGSTPTTTGSSGQATGSFTNPVLWEDLADNDVFRVGSTYYYTASNMHYSPGAPILRSYDLANWEYIGHAVPTLDWADKYNLPSSGARAYVKGTWASTMRYRPSTGLYYFIACIEFGSTYVYTASDPAGTWTKRATINTCLYDAGLLVDEDTDTMYVAYGNTDIYVAQLTSDGFGIAQNTLVYSASFYLEGARMYKKDGYFYVFLTRPANAQYILRSTTPFSGYTLGEVVYEISPPVSGAGYPHQGSLVDTQNGDWYYMAFIDAYPGGRVPVLAPVTWSSGWPVVTSSNGGWGTSYPYTLPQHSVTPTTGTDDFSSGSLSPMYEWNHNPDTSSFSLGSAGLTLRTASVTYDIYQARNTLTRRIHGPQGTATMELDYSGMSTGDRAGLVLLRDSSTWIGIKNDGGSTALCVVNNIAMNDDWTTAETGSTPASQAISGGKVWLRGTADIRPAGTKAVQFSYSTDGNSFTNFGPSYTMGTDWHFFMGYRWGMFNYATQALGGSVVVESFTSV